MQAFDQRQFRDALGQFATGVTVVTAIGEDGPVGMTVNSFASVSLEPPLVLWSVARDSDRADAFEQADFFAVHVLPEDSRDLALRFAACGSDFNGIEIACGAGGLPLLDTYCARFECHVVARHPGGDHLILVGEVLAFRVRPSPALVFHAGRFGQLTSG